jgi:hypothetical protein
LTTTIQNIVSSFKILKIQTYLIPHSHLNSPMSLPMTLRIYDPNRIPQCKYFNCNASIGMFNWNTSLEMFNRNTSIGICNWNSVIRALWCACTAIQRIGKRPRATIFHWRNCNNPEKKGLFFSWQQRFWTD